MSIDRGGRALTTHLVPDNRQDPDSPWASSAVKGARSRGQAPRFQRPSTLLWVNQPDRLGPSLGGFFITIRARNSRWLCVRHAAPARYRTAMELLEAPDRRARGASTSVSSAVIRRSRAWGGKNSVDLPPASRFVLISGIHRHLFRQKRHFCQLASYRQARSHHERCRTDIDCQSGSRSCGGRSRWNQLLRHRRWPDCRRPEYRYRQDRALLRLRSIPPQVMPLKSHCESGYHTTVLWRTMELTSA